MVIGTSVWLLLRHNCLISLPATAGNLAEFILSQHQNLAFRLFQQLLMPPGIVLGFRIVFHLGSPVLWLTLWVCLCG